MQTLTGKVALITGAARGMGRNHAVRLAEEGAAIIAVDICATVAGISYPMATADDLAETERLVRARGSKIASAQVDIRDSHALQAAIDRAVAELGGLHIVVANAGVLALARSEEFTQPQWDAVISVNLTGTWNTIRAAVPHLTTCGGGSIIAIASAAGLVGLPFLDPYVASKHGIVGLVKAFAIELAEKGIRVNAICPTGVPGTEITKHYNNNSRIFRKHLKNCN